MASWLIPDARSSNTSMMRMRIPRMHGRPPHWPGLTVIRCNSSVVFVIDYPFHAAVQLYYLSNSAAMTLMLPKTATTSLIMCPSIILGKVW
jgi:hypothetical protein